MVGAALSVSQAFEQLQLPVYQALLLRRELEGLLCWESPGHLHMRAVFKVRSPTRVQSVGAKSASSGKGKGSQ